MLEGRYTHVPAVSGGQYVGWLFGLEYAHCQHKPGSTGRFVINEITIGGDKITAVSALL